MAELIITEEERTQLRFLQWSDDALGKACKKVAIILNDQGGERAVKWEGAAIFLIATVTQANAAEAVFKVEGASEGEIQYGDWEITFKRLDQ